MARWSLSSTECVTVGERGAEPQLREKQERVGVEDLAHHNILGGGKSED